MLATKVNSGTMVGDIVGATDSHHERFSFRETDEAQTNNNQEVTAVRF